MSVIKTIGDFELAEDCAAVAWSGKSGVEKYVRIFDMKKNTLERECLLIGYALSDFKTENDVIEAVTYECPEAID